MEENSSPKVSVIVPVYNVAPYLKQCVDTLIAQTLKDAEFIFLDDGSTDNSLDILNSYAAIDPRVHVFSHKNIGAGATRNRGIDLAHGDYLIFLDSDDYFAPTLLQDCYDCALQNDADVVMFHSLRYNNQTGEIRDAPKNKLGLMPKDVCEPSDIRDTFSQFTRAVAWDKFMRRELILREAIRFLERQNPEDTEVCEDMYFSYLVVLLAKRIARLDKKLLYHRVYRQESLYNIANSNHFLEYAWVNAFASVKNDLIKKGTFAFWEEGFAKWSKSVVPYWFNTKSLQDIPFRERIRICRTLRFWATPFQLLGIRTFLREHSPRWFIRFVKFLRTF